ncbi:unnamed protein product [Trichobilharzia regenti]|nr:unnamed protein product [Trichobilharzia regenti]
MNSSFVIGSDSFTSKLLKCWTEFLSVRKSLRGKPDNQNYSEISKEFTEAEITNVIRVTLNDLISPSHTKSVDFHEVIAYYFFKALLISDKNIENESGDSVTDEIQENSQTVILFRETFYTELFSKIDCILEILLKEVSSNAMEHPVSCMCVAIGLISDLIKDPSLTSLSLYHLEEMWHKFGAFIKKLIEHIVSINKEVAVLLLVNTIIHKPL